MNNLLITNPFLFPPSGDNEEERGLFKTRAEYIRNYILFSLKDFNTTWETTAENNSRENTIDLFPVPLCSPTVSTTSTEEISPSIDIMDFNDEYLLNSNYNFEDFQFSPIGDDLDKKESSEEKSTEISHERSNQDFAVTLEKALGHIDADSDTMCALPQSGKSALDENTLPCSQTSNFESQTMEMEAMGMMSLVDFDLVGFVNDDSRSAPMTPAAASDNFPLPAASMSVILPALPGEVDMKPELALQVQTETRSNRQRRKSVQVSRNIESSPFSFEREEEPSFQLSTILEAEVIKTEPLAPLNGTESRNRDVKPCTSASLLSPAPSTKVNKNGEARKKRKYECEDETDPSVKNAKAAKMNRDKKKLLMNELQNTNKNLADENQKLTQRVSELEQEKVNLKFASDTHIQSLYQQLQAEKEKNSSNSKQKVVMLDVIKNVCSAMNPPPIVIQVSERLGSTHMPSEDEINNIRMNAAVTPTTGNESHLLFKVGVGQPTIFIDCENSKH